MNKQDLNEYIKTYPQLNDLARFNVKENFNIQNKFEMTFASKVTKQTFKTYKC